MPCSFFSPIGRVAGIVAALALAMAAGPVSAEPVQPPAGPAAAQPSSLRVTGTALQITVEADHADVQKTLKSLFDQANKQFDVDSTVAGTVTLRLTDQTFETVLKSICKQAFLRYQQDAGTGIYHLERDPEMIKESFSHLDSLNADLRRQLRALGLELPEDAQLDRMRFSQNRVNAKAMLPAPNGPEGTAGRSLSVPDKQAASGANGRGGAAASRGSVEDKQKDENLKQDAPKFKEGVIMLPEGLSQGALDMLFSSPNVDKEQLPVLEQNYLEFLHQNNLVAFNSNGAQYPMTDVLKELGRQANVPIWIDPSVPSGKQFRISLNLPPHTLEEALNLILPASRLRWRWIGSSVYVTPTPSFQIFYGSAPQPYVIYGNFSNSQSQQRGQQNNAHP